MFFDWITCYQDFGQKLPVVSERMTFVVDSVTKNVIYEKQEAFTIEGSHDTSARISVSGRRVMFSGNPSRWGRRDNLFGFESLDDCFLVINQILAKVFVGCDFVPQFTKNEKLMYSQIDNSILGGDGARITRIDLTTNIEVGEGKEYSYISALGNLPYRNSVPQVFSNGSTVRWLTKLGRRSRLIDAKAYLKAEEIEAHLLRRVTTRLGKNSKEALYVERLISFCRARGIVRLEQRLQSEFLNREGLTFWGQFEQCDLNPVHEKFLAIDECLTVTKLEIESISDELLRRGIVTSTQSANATSCYAIKWMNGERLDRTRSQVRTCRARLKAIGIDIYSVYDATSRKTPFKVTKIHQVNVRTATPPSFYIKAEVAKAA